MEYGDACASSVSDYAELTTVGVDVGSTTAHLLISRLKMQRLFQSLSSRFVVVERETLWRSPITLTPYLSGGEIDAGALGRFVGDGYRRAGLTSCDVDTGAVILTGEALKQRNAQAIADEIAEDTGRFVCTSAGHELESVLAAHGSGAVDFARAKDAVVLHIDIGGGTSKLCLVDRGDIVAVAALEVGARCVVLTDGRISIVTEAARRVAAERGCVIAAGDALDPDTEALLVDTLCEALVAAAAGCEDELVEALLVTVPFAPSLPPDFVTFSGGVSEYLYGREQNSFGDLGGSLARAIASAAARGRLGAPIAELAPGIRATALGASQFTVEASGNTIGADGDALPLRNVPVVRCHVPVDDEIAVSALVEEVDAAGGRLGLDLRAGGVPVALAVHWHGSPAYRRLRAVAEMVAEVSNCLEGSAPLVVIIDVDIARNLYGLLREEFGMRRPLVCVDGLRLTELDYVDVGQCSEPAGFVPVIVKSLLFTCAGGEDSWERIA